MAALSSKDGLKKLRLTYQELLELADVLENEKKERSAKRRSKENATDTSSDPSISPTKNDESLENTLENRTPTSKKSEKRIKDDKKSSKKRDPEKKKHKERSPRQSENTKPEKQANDENLSNQNVDIKSQEISEGEGNEQGKAKEKKKAHKHRSSKSKERNIEETTADVEENVGKLQMDEEHQESPAKDSKTNRRSKNKDEKEKRHSEKKEKSKRPSIEKSDLESEKEDVKGMNKEEDNLSKHGGILKSPLSKPSHSHAHVSFNEETDSYVIPASNTEERGILRIPPESIERVDASSSGMQNVRDNNHIRHRDVDNTHTLDSNTKDAKKPEVSRSETTEQGGAKIPSAEKRMRVLNKQRAQQLMKQAHHAETALANLLSKDVTDKGALNKVFTLSNEIQDLYQGVIMLDLSFAHQHDIDQLLWKSAFYHVIETFRKYGKLFLGYSNQKNTISPEEINTELYTFLENAKSFYTGLLQGLQKTYHFDVEDIVNQPRKAEFLARSAKLALLSCHHALIFVGDIERYKEQLHSTSTVNWSGIRSWYLKASKLAPKNGKPYNQLAVIAVYANRKLDAVFYYVRSLSVNSPILTAKEKLTTIFHEIQKKADQLQWEEEMHRRKQETQKVQQEKGRGRGRERNIFREAAKGVGLVGDKEPSHGRQEIWVFTRQGKCRRLILTGHGTVQQVDATGNPITRDAPENTEKHKEPIEESPKISLQQVNKKYMLHFLCAHGLLYSRIGMERLPALQVQLIGELHTLLRFQQCSSVGRIPLLQMSAINMFAIEHTASREDSETFVRLGTPQDQALNLAVDMLIAVLKACTEVLLSTRLDGSHGDSGNNGGLCTTLKQYIPTIKVWFDWMVCYQDLWQASNISIHRTLWEEVANFTNALLDLEIPCFEEDDTGKVLITLNEDEFLAGFKPLADAPRYSVTINSTSHKDLVEDHLHIAAVREFAMLLSSTTHPVLQYCEETSKYTAIIPSVATSQEQQRSIVDAVHMDVDHPEDQELYESDEVIIESVLENIDSGDETDKGFKELKAKKDQLAKELEVQEEKHSKVKAVIHENISRSHLVFENYPSYLVSDTNCFIDHLSGLQAIVLSNDFTLVVPIVVINELDGLKKDFIIDKYHDINHAQMVMSNARAAIDFLEDQFSLRSPYVKALTSRGTVMDTIAFRSEDTSCRQGNNDDVILSCCLHYCEENFVNRLATADQPITIRRNVVLLTDDRNLRVKAYTRNVPVLTVPQFRQMARL